MYSPILCFNVTKQVYSRWTFSKMVQIGGVVDNMPPFDYVHDLEIQFSFQYSLNVVKRWF